MDGITSDFDRHSLANLIYNLKKGDDNDNFTTKATLNSTVFYNPSFVAASVLLMVFMPRALLTVIAANVRIVRDKDPQLSIISGSALFTTKSENPTLINLMSYSGTVPEIASMLILK